MKTVIVTITTPPVATRTQEKVMGVHGPMKADEAEIFKYLAGNHKVMEVLEDGSQVELTWDNYKEDNSGTTEPDPGEPETPPPTFVAVTGIDGIPTTAKVGDEWILANIGTVKPASATNKTMEWYKVADGTETKITDGKVAFPEEGSAKLKVVIKNGKTASTDFIKEVTVTVSAADPVA